MASLWESNLNDRLAQRGVFLELPRLSSKASVIRCQKLLRERCVPDLSEFLAAIAQMRTTYSSEDVATHMAGILNQSGISVVVCVVDREVSVFTKQLGTRFPEAFLTKCREMICIQAETPLAWSETMDGLPLETTAAFALYGQEPGQSSLPPFTGNKLRQLRQRFAASDHHSAPSQKGAPSAL